MKKLTAGIFTVMMGLVAANSADAAVASKGYVDTKVGDNTTLITNLTQTVADNKSAAETAIAGEKSARETAVAALEKADTDNLAAAQTYAEGKASAAQAAAEATAASALSKAVEALEGQITSAGADTTALTGRVTTAEGKITAIETEQGEQNDKISALETSLAEGGDTDKAIAEAKKAGTDAAAALETYKTANEAALALKGDKTAVEKNAEDIAKNAQAIAAEELERTNADNALDARITSNTTAITTLNGDKNTAGSVAKSIADAFTTANLSQYATLEYTDGALAKYTKTEALGALAMKNTVGTEDIDNLAVTTAKLADGAVDSNKLGKDAVTNNAVADGALSQNKIDGLDTTLATKMNITAEKTQDGKYVLTATVSENGTVADYAWESIER